MLCLSYSVFYLPRGFLAVKHTHTRTHAHMHKEYSGRITGLGLQGADCRVLNTEPQSTERRHESTDYRGGSTDVTST